MDSLIKKQAGLVRELLDSSSDIGIIVGENQNIDTMGAALGLYLILAQDGKNVQVVSKKEPTVEISNLFGIDRVAKSFEGATRILTISVPYREGEIEKVSYNIEENSLNVNLFAEENGISFSEKEVKYIKKGTAPSLIITIGVPNEGELEELVDPKSVKTIHIDINPLNSLTGDVVIIDPSFSSLSEIVATLAKELSISLDADALQNLMDGIVYATRNFTSPNTSAYAFEAAGFLLANGARRKEKKFESGRDRNFPREDHFREPKADRPDVLRGPKFNSGVGNQFQPRQQPITNYPPKITGESVTNPVSNNPPSKDSLPEANPSDVTSKDIPDDWFLPKVFKGTRKGN